MVVKTKKAKGTNSMPEKENLILKIIKLFRSHSTWYKICHLEKNKIDIYRLKENHKELTRKNKHILKIQQRFKSEKHNIFTKEVNKISLSSNNDKRIQSIDSIVYRFIYAYGTSKDLVEKI